MKIFKLTLFLCIASVALGYGKPTKNKVQPFNKIDSLSCSIGINIGNSLKASGVDKVNETLFAEAIAAVLKGDSLKISMENANKFLQQYVQQLTIAKQAENIKKGKAFLTENGKKPDVFTTASGLQYKVIKAGTGEKPAETDKVTVHYNGSSSSPGS